jgi:aryl-alcohol dehydrogenase-like predicted oxidoreductase
MFDLTHTSVSPEFVLGTAQLGTSYGVSRRRTGAPKPEPPGEFLAAAERMGVSILDTAPAYGDAELLIGDSGTCARVHTKLSPLAHPSESVATSLRRLRRNTVDVLYLHESSLIVDPSDPILDAAAALVGSATRALGVSIYDEDELEAALRDPRFAVVQVPLSLFDRRFGGPLIAEAAQLGKEVFVRSALLQGALAMPASELPPVLVELRPFLADFHRLAGDLRRTPVELALGWVRSVPGVCGIVVGTSSILELQELVAAFRSDPLTRSELDQLDQLPSPARHLTDPRAWR